MGKKFSLRNKGTVHGIVELFTIHKSNNTDLRCCHPAPKYKSSIVLETINSLTNTSKIRHDECPELISIIWKDVKDTVLVKLYLSSFFQNFFRKPQNYRKIFGNPKYVTFCNLRNYFVRKFQQWFRYKFHEFLKNSVFLLKNSKCPSFQNSRDLYWMGTGLYW